MMDSRDVAGENRGSGIVPEASPRQRAGCPRHVRIVLSGPESSGKSTMAAALAERFGLSCAPEHARVHLESGGAYPPSPEALVALAREHLAWQRECVAPEWPCGIFDTDMLNYFVWADVAFGHVPPEIEAWFAGEAHHVHLLCEPDLDWQPDPLREFPDPGKRRMLFERYRTELERRGMRHFIIRGTGDARVAMAADCVRQALENQV
ncbi:MAG: AAA family ATPase [Luteolibacter sp.]|jgi:nicotinamide riboside kinase